jgi:hypothetical protein
MPMARRHRRPDVKVGFDHCFGRILKPRDAAVSEMLEVCGDRESERQERRSRSERLAIANIANIGHQDFPFGTSRMRAEKANPSCVTIGMVTSIFSPGGG